MATKQFEPLDMKGIVEALKLNRLADGSMHLNANKTEMLLSTLERIGKNYNDQARLLFELYQVLPEAAEPPKTISEQELDERMGPPVI